MSKYLRTYILTLIICVLLLICVQTNCAPAPLKTYNNNNNNNSNNNNNNNYNNYDNNHINNKNNNNNYNNKRAQDHVAQTIVYYNQPADEHGNFHFEFQTSNGITIKSAGNEFGHSGVVQYISAEGVPITMTYVADEDGYHPEGEHIPKIPLYVFKSLEYIRTHPQIDEIKSRKL